MNGLHSFLRSILELQVTNKGPQVDLGEDWSKTKVIN